MPKKYASPEAGYLVSRYRVEVKGDTKQAAAMNSYARIIAEERLRTLKEGDTLPALRRNKDGLELPIKVNPEALNREQELAQSQRRVILEWLQLKPEYCFIHGEKVSEIWQQELARVDRQIRQLSERFERHAYPGQAEGRCRNVRGGCARMPGRTAP